MQQILASSAEIKCGQPGVTTWVNLGSTWGQPGVNMRSTWGQPGVNLGSTRGQPGISPGSAQGQPGVKLGSTLGQPAPPHPDHPGVAPRGDRCGAQRRRRRRGASSGEPRHVHCGARGTVEGPPVVGALHTNRRARPFTRPSLALTVRPRQKVLKH